MRQNITISLSIIVLTLLFLSISGCSEDISSKNMEQLYADQGVPVKVETVKQIPFSKGLEYNAVLTGYKESSAITTIASKVESIKYAIGDYVEKDVIVLTFPTDDPSAQYYQSKLAYENALSSFKRVKEYFNSGGISQNEYENAETSYKVAEANWNSVKQSVLLKAPISGIITRFNVNLSDNVAKDQELFTVSQIDKVKTRIWVSDADIQKIDIGQNVTAVWHGMILSGKVVQVDLSMNQMKKAFAVDVVFDNQNQKMPTGITAKVRIETYVNSKSIFIERKNIIKKDTIQFVFLNNSGIAQKQIIETGITSGTSIEITNGLKPGDELIIEGQMLLEDNKKINLITD